jgi:hypothetical protein
MVAMGAVRVVKVPADQVVDVVAVGHSLVPAVGPVLVVRLVFAAVMSGRAVGRVGLGYRHRVSLHLAARVMVHLTVVQVVDVIVVPDRGVTAVGSMLVVVGITHVCLASIVFAVIVVQEAQLPNTSTILLATYTTIGLSVIAHGISAARLAGRYGRWYQSHPHDRRPAMESVPAPGHRTRGTTANTTS